MALLVACKGAFPPKPFYGSIMRNLADPAGQKPGDAQVTSELATEVQLLQELDPTVSRVTQIHGRAQSRKSRAAEGPKATYRSRIIFKNHYQII